jgi:hypothetical protein
MVIRTSVQAFKFRYHVAGQRWTLIEWTKILQMFRYWNSELLQYLERILFCHLRRILPTNWRQHRISRASCRAFASCSCNCLAKRNCPRSPECVANDFISCRWERARERESASGKFYEMNKSGRNLSSCFQISETLHCVNSLSFVLLYVVKSHIFSDLWNTSLCEQFVICFAVCCKITHFKFRVLWNKLVATFKLFPWISPVVCTVIDVWHGDHCQHKW